MTATRLWRAGNPGIEIFPIRIILLDQPYLPGPIPFLQPLLALDGIFGIVELLVVNQSSDVVFLGETLNQFQPMFGNSTDEIARHPDVQRSVGLAGEMYTTGCFTRRATRFRERALTAGQIGSPPSRG